MLAALICNLTDSPVAPPPVITGTSGIIRLHAKVPRPLFVEAPPVIWRVSLRSGPDRISAKTHIAPEIRRSIQVAEQGTHSVTLGIQVADELAVVLALI